MSLKRHQNAPHGQVLTFAIIVAQALAFVSLSNGVVDAGDDRRCGCAGGEVGGSESTHKRTLQLLTFGGDCSPLSAERLLVVSHFAIICEGRGGGG